MKSHETREQQVNALESLFYNEGHLITRILNKAHNKGKRALAILAAVMQFSTAIAHAEDLRSSSKDLSSSKPRVFSLTLKDIQNKQKEKPTEIINSFYYKSSKFYKDISIEKGNRAIFAYFESVRVANSYNEFLNQLKTLNLSYKQKLLILQKIGETLNSLYNSDLFNSNDPIRISAEEMFQGIKNNKAVGISGNIHTFLTRVAQSLDFEAWFQITALSHFQKDPSGGHGTMGLIVKDGNGNEQIAFIDFGSLILTGTLDFKEALGVLEKRNHTVTLGGSVNTNVDEAAVIIPFSEAQETIMDSAGMNREPGSFRALESGYILPRDRGLKIELGDRKEIELSGDHIALAFSFYENPGNFYNSLEELKALRLQLRWANKNLKIEGGPTLFNFNVSDLYNPTSFEQELLVANILVNYVNSLKLNKEEYDKFVFNFGVQLQAAAAISLPFDLSKDLNIFQVSGRTQLGLGARIIYIDPKDQSKIFIEPYSEFLTIGSYSEDYLLGLKKFFDQITIGTSRRVQEVKIEIETAIRNLRYGDEQLISFGVSNNKSNIKTTLSKAEPNETHKRFWPSKNSVTLDLSHEFRRATITVFGKLDTQNNPKSAENTFGVKLMINFQ